MKFPKLIFNITDIYYFREKEIKTDYEDQNALRW